MTTEIEKLNKRRKNIVKGTFVTTLIAFIWFMLPNIRTGLIENSYQSSYTALIGAGLFWIFSLLIFGVLYIVYKNKLRSVPSLYAAVNDDRIKMAWLKSYRIAFFAAFFTSVLWRILTPPIYSSLFGTSSFRKFIWIWMMKIIKIVRLPNGPFLVLYIAVLCLFASFLFFSREVKNG